MLQTLCGQMIHNTQQVTDMHRNITNLFTVSPVEVGI